MILDVKDLKFDPKEFDWIPPVYESEKQDGWTMLAKTIIKSDANSSILLLIISPLANIINAIKKAKLTKDLNEGYYDPLSSKSLSY